MQDLDNESNQEVESEELPPLEELDAPDVYALAAEEADKIEAQFKKEKQDFKLAEDPEPILPLDEIVMNAQLPGNLEDIEWQEDEPIEVRPELFEGIEEDQEDG